MIPQLVKACRSAFLGAAFFLSGCALSPARPLTSAGSIEINVLLVYGDVNYAYAKDVFLGAADYLRQQTGVTLKVVDERRMRHLGPFDSAGTSLQLLLAKLHRHADQRLVFGMFSDSLMNLNHGASSVGTSGRSTSAGYACLMGIPGRDLKVVLHELGHGLGADHTYSGLMFPDVSGLWLATGFSETSKREIARHLRRISPVRFARPFRSDYWSGKNS